ncbi:MAG: HD-GYP domain-containing protein [Candidatus Korobacteraceae bacterium]
MKPETLREMDEVLAHYGYSRVDRSTDQPECDEAVYSRRSAAGEADARTEQWIYVQEDGYWEHRFQPHEEDRTRLTGGSGKGVDSLREYLQREERFKQLGEAAILLPTVEPGTPLWKAIGACVSALETKDLVTRGHCANVSRLAARTALQMGLSEDAIEEIRLAGLVHDIGKLIVPLGVLTKPAPLTPEELAVMREHAVSGAQIFEPLNVKGINRIVFHHHERYDGKGYRGHLKGDDIPLGARIVALAEAFDVMVNDQRYKSARTFEDAVAELRSCSGTQFDPKVVTAFLDWREIHEDPREQR